jgi:tetratricopeptide (TPR) repeat protein
VLLDRALVAFPDDALLLHYQGYALWREAALVLGMRKPDEARPLLEAADRALERAAAGRPLPETLALHASVLGQRIAVGGMADGIRFGPRSGALMGEAERAGPRNPRVWLLRGMNAMFAPAAFGGGLDRAETALRRAAALFESDRAAPPAPTWGQADVHVALGQVYAKQGRRDEARAAYRQVLALQPDNAWVRSVLLPALDRPSR